MPRYESSLGTSSGTTAWRSGLTQCIFSETLRSLHQRLISPRNLASAIAASPSRSNANVLGTKSDSPPHHRQRTAQAQSSRPRRAAAQASIPSTRGIGYRVIEQTIQDLLSDSMCPVSKTLNQLAVSYIE